MILSGAGLVEASPDNKIKQHITQTVDKTKDIVPANTGADIKTAGLIIPVSYAPYLDNEHKDDDYVYVFFMKDGEIISEPYLAHTGVTTGDDGFSITVKGFDRATGAAYTANDLEADYGKCDSVMVDYYTERESGAKQIEITADKFGGNYYLEASTLFRNQDGVDMPAEFIIPNCKIQSNFNFTMASSGDPSTFTFTMDAFPDYTRFDHSKKVLAAIQIIEEDETVDNDIRRKTAANSTTVIGG